MSRVILNLGVTFLVIFSAPFIPYAILSAGFEKNGVMNL